MYPVEGIFKLPKALRRDLIILFVIKIAMLTVLYLLFFSPTQRPIIDTAAHILDVQPAP